MQIRFILLAAAVSAAPPTQVRLTFHADADTLVAGWTSAGVAPGGATLVQAGATPASLGASLPGTALSFESDECPGANNTRTSHAAPFPAPAGAVTYYRVSADGGASWSAVLSASNPSRGFPQTVALWGDMGIECGGVLPAQPGFAGGQCTAVPQLAKDSAAGAHDLTIHFGDTAYNMGDRCGEKGGELQGACSREGACSGCATIAPACMRLSIVFVDLTPPCRCVPGRCVRVRRLPATRLW